MSDAPFFSVSSIPFGRSLPLALILGPCVIEGEKEALYACEAIKKELGERPFVFKSSFDKANRSSIHSYRGPGLDKGLRILEKIKKEFEVPLLTDIHEPRQASVVASICDILQIPAFLSRQTDLLVAAAQTGAVVNVKKGQFLSPFEMKNVVEKLKEAGCTKILLTDRGTTFGYNNLVVDFRAVPIMQSFNVPVCFDATHAVQLPGKEGAASGGERQFVETLAKAAVAVGVDALFLEVHPNPSEAKSDAASQLSIKDLKPLLETLDRLKDALYDPLFSL